MPHLLAYKTPSANARHLARWNNSPTSAARHLGAGYVAVTLSRDAYKYFVWGDYYHRGSVDLASGYIAASSRAGEESVADQLYNAVKAGNSQWPELGNDWFVSNWAQPCYWYYCGGMCLSGRTSADLAAEAAMGIGAYHFTLPEVYRNLDIIDAQIEWRGLGSWVQNLLRPTSQPMFYPMKTWDDNNSCWGANYKLVADYYEDSQSIAVHIVHGNSLSRSNFNPAKCFFVYDNTNQHNAYELRNLNASCAERIGRNPTPAELLAWFNVDLSDAQNDHWHYLGYGGSRSTTASSVRFANQVYSMANGGTEAIQQLYTSSGSGWGFPYITGSANYPQTGGDYLRPVLTLTDADKEALKSAGGLWIIMHGLPQLARTSLSGGNYLPITAHDWECGPWRGAANQSAVGRYIGTGIESMDTYQLKVVVG